MWALLITGWLLLPLGAVAYHHGPGQAAMARDLVDDAVRAARAAAAAGDHAAAAESFELALGALPPGHAREAQRIRLERAKSTLRAGALFTARDDLRALVEELEQADDAPALLADARTSLASAQFYITWLLRLEGQPREVWEPEADAARQHYRLLADDEASAARERDLAAAVRLARMDLTELQGLPLPEELQGQGQGEGRGKKPGQGQQPGRGQGQERQDARGASAGPPIDGEGS